MEAAALARRRRTRGLKPLDLDDEDESEGRSELARDEGGQSPASRLLPAGDEAVVAKRRRKAKGPKGEPTADDLAALNATDWTALKAEVDALRQRINAMGAINLVAIEEYSELKQRHDFLTTQVNDLTTAKAEW